MKGHGRMNEGHRPTPEHYKTVQANTGNRSDINSPSIPGRKRRGGKMGKGY